MLRGCSAVNAAGLDRDEETTTLLQEVFRVKTNDSGLIGLGNVSEDDIDHGEKHAVSHRLAGIFHDGDNVCAASLGEELVMSRKEITSEMPTYRHIDKITARTVGEFDGKDSAGGSDNIGDVGY